jgi:transposase-like protein
MIRLDIREVVGKYLTAMMNAELTHFLGREPYVRVTEAVNHRNGSGGYDEKESKTRKSSINGHIRRQMDCLYYNSKVIHPPIR